MFPLQVRIFYSLETTLSPNTSTLNHAVQRLLQSEIEERLENYSTKS